MKERFEGNFLTSTEHIRWSDMDIAGIMYFGNYARLFEIAETDLFHAMGVAYSPAIFDAWNAYPLRKTYQIEFFAPLRLNDTATIRIGASAIGKASFTLYFEVFSALQNVCTAIGSCTIVFVHKETFKPTPMPETVRNGLALYALTPVTS